MAVDEANDERTFSVVYVEDAAVPGAAAALRRFRDRQTPIRLVTNTTMRPRRSIRTSSSVSRPSTIPRWRPPAATW